MAVNEREDQHYHLASPAVSAPRDETATTIGARDPAPMERTASIDMRSEREDLKIAAEQSLNVILDLALDGTIRWVSASWKDVVGTDIETVKGKPITDVLRSSKDAFTNAIESMKKDDSKSQIIRFRLQVGPLSVLKHCPLAEDDVSSEGNDQTEEINEEEQYINLKGQGIMVYDRSSGDESHVCIHSTCLGELTLTYRRQCGCYDHQPRRRK